MNLNKCDMDIEGMEYNERVKYITGELILSIGEGNFKDRVSWAIGAITSEAFKRGVKDGQSKSKFNSKEIQLILKMIKLYNNNIAISRDYLEEITIEKLLAKLNEH